ncbi:MAG: trigger factor, partial [Spirochaetaceae bacterium]|nr:trigger factor [Spirochaetaceae bacterium]
RRTAVVRRPIFATERYAPVISSKNVEKLEKSAIKLTLTVPKDLVRGEYDAMLKDYSRSVRIDGFRAGHVPASVLERKFGDSLRLDAMGRVLEKAVQEAVEGIPEKPLAYSQPSLDGEPTFALDSDFTFSVIYDVFPEVSVGDWKGIEITVPDAKVSKEDEERELAEVRERNAIVLEKEAASTAVSGDVATVSYREIGPDGTAVAGSERSDFTFEIGTGYNLYKFDAEVIGMVVGQEKTVDKTYPADFEHAELAGRTVKVAVALTKLKAKKLPELDDELAQDVSEKYSTLQDLKDDIRKHLERRLEAKLRQLREKAVVEALLARSTYELPRSMVDAELGMRVESMKRQMGLDADDKFDRMLSYSGKTRADLAEDWRPSAEKAIATRLILEKLLADGTYECSDADLEAEFARQAEEAGVQIADVMAEYEKRGSMDYLKDRVKEDKLMADIIAAAKVAKGPAAAFVDLLKDSE